MQSTTPTPTAQAGDPHAELLATIEDITSDQPRPWHIILSGRLTGQYATIVGGWQQARTEATNRFGHGWSHQYDDPAKIEGLAAHVDRRIVDVELARAAAIREQITRDKRAALVAGLRQLAEPEQVAEPDYWTGIADDLERVAGLIRTLAGTPTPDTRWTLRPTLQIVTTYADHGHEQVIPIIDRIAVAFGSTAAVDSGRGAWPSHRMGVLVGGLNVEASARIPAPEDPEVAALRARVAELEAQQAGGAA